LQFAICNLRSKTAEEIVQNNCKLKIENCKSRAFTLIELLIVIGIIVVLVGILIPVAGKVREAVNTANTRQMIQRIEAGINAYYSDFGAYPGPIANAQVRPFTTAVPAINTINLTYTNVPSTPAVSAVTASENLFLGLAGGLEITVNTASPPAVNAFRYNYNNASTFVGPGNLNPGNIKRINPYINAEVNETTLGVANEARPSGTIGQWMTAGSGGFVGDSIIPEFLDKYPRPAPIVYMRANRGAANFLDPAINPWNTTTPPLSGTYQYNPAAAIYVYGGSQTPAVGSAMDGAWNIILSDYPISAPYTSKEQTYFGNASASTTVATPAQKDGYILISAGPDGRFGTRDDVTNFRGQ